MEDKKKVAVLVSGGGTNLQAILDYEASHKECPYTVALVLCNKSGAYAIERAAKAKVPCFMIAYPAICRDSPKGQATQPTKEDKALAVSCKALEYCRAYKIEFIVLAGFLTVLKGPIIEEYSERIINLHPALLPKYGGKGMWGRHVHEAVLEAHEKVSGCTVHLVDKGCDTGRILVQKRVPVMDNDTPDSLYARIAPKEHEAIVEGLLMLCNGA